MRITMKDLTQAEVTLNNNLALVGSKHRFEVKHRYNYYALDRVPANNPHLVDKQGIVTGTKKEVYTYIVALLDGMELVR